jgi:hypothetical protein
MSIFTKPCPIKEAFELLKLPNEVQDWLSQTAYYAPDFPRRLINNELCVVPDQLADYIVHLHCEHWVANGPYADWCQDEDDDPENDEEDDDAKTDFDDDENDHRHRRLPKPSGRRNRRPE